MTCDCRHAAGGECRRFPPVPVIEMGRTAWRFPRAEVECGERAAVTPDTGEAEAKPEKGANTAPEAATKPQRGKKASGKTPQNAKGAK